MSSIRYLDANHPRQIYHERLLKQGLIESFDPSTEFVLYVGGGLITVEVVRKPSVISAAAKVFYLHLCVPALENAACSILYATNALNTPVVCVPVGPDMWLLQSRVLLSTL